MKVFKDFVATRCGQRKLARLTVAANERDLVNAINVALPAGRRERIPDLLTADPSLLGFDVGQPMIAEVLCFSGQVTARVRRGHSVRRHQLLGRDDARELNAHGLRLTLVGFRLSTVSGRVGTPGPQDLPDRVWIYAATQVLPELKRAEAVRRDLQDRTGVETHLVLRTHPHFFDYRGPRCDVFEVPHPAISKEEFLRSPFIVCWPEDRGGVCKLLSSPTEYVVKPVVPIAR
jgi:hypothetical protein